MALRVGVGLQCLHEHEATEGRCRKRGSPPQVRALLISPIPCVAPVLRGAERSGPTRAGRCTVAWFVALAALWLARRRAGKAVRQRMPFRRPPARSNRGEMQGRMSTAPDKKSPCKGLTTNAAVGKLLHLLEIRL